MEEEKWYKRLNAKHGVALMVIITIIIAVFVYFYVEGL